ncbi:hypothetical protein CDL15_Pgr002720 [Punica granatum]|uniref:Uncharacterized protein n=1 Tax=Punica granatum TaxID=22663 RepID=A0A218XJ73_PUNGR|nr:hypothetical protein CDL15_Pgr002720 [Punica granatum]
MGQSASADVPDISPSIHPHPYLPLYSTYFTAFRTSRPRTSHPRTSRPLYCFSDFASTDFASALLLSGLRVRSTAFWTSRPRTSRPLYCFLGFASTDFASALLLYGLRVHGLRVRFTAFWTSRPLYCFMDFASWTSRSLYCFMDFASALLLYGLRVRFTAFWTSRPLYRYLDFASALLLSAASALRLPLHIPQILVMLLSHDRRGELSRRKTIEAVARTKKGCLLWSLATSSNRARNQRGASCQHLILAHWLPT